MILHTSLYANLVLKDFVENSCAAYLCGNHDIQYILLQMI